jgi:lysozyme
MAKNGIDIKISPDGLKFITQVGFDSFKAQPYKDPGGLWTIGYGTLLNNAQAEKYKDGITVEQGLAFVQLHMQLLYPQLNKCPLAGLFQYQYDSIISLAYNIGFEAFQKSTVYQHITTRSGDVSSWLLFIRDAQGHVDQGLVKRRKAELRLFTYGLYI